MNPKHKTDETNGSLGIFKRIGIICGALLALGSVLQAITMFLLGLALKPIHDEIREERIARQFSDSLLVTQMAFLAEAVRQPSGSAARERAVTSVTLAPYKLEAEKQRNEGHH